MAKPNAFVKRQSGKEAALGGKSCGDFRSNRKREIG